MSTTQDADLTISYVPLAVPAGSVVDHIDITCTGTDSANNQPTQSVAPRTGSVTFANLNPDTYTFTAQAMPASGPGFGTPVSTTLAVTATTVTVQVPGTITAVQP